MELDACLALVAEVGSRVHAIKIHSLYDSIGPSVIARLKDAGAQRVWVDAKLHDIPETVKLRAKAFAAAGADMLTVHASGGIDMMAAAAKAFAGEVIGITLLTSLSDQQAIQVYGHQPKDTAICLARLAAHAELPSVVCSPREVASIAAEKDLSRLNFIVPGTRSVGKAAGDQARVTTPGAAIKAGATKLVIGRQVTTAPDPVAALDELEAEINVELMKLGK
jgi:orotidine-5'-phosphate decarboxylase